MLEEDVTTESTESIAGEEEVTVTITTGEEVDVDTDTESAFRSDDEVTIAADSVEVLLAAA